MLWVMIKLAITTLVGWIAYHKGFSFWAYFFFAFFAGAVLSLITLRIAIRRADASITPPPLQA